MWFGTLVNILRGKKIFHKFDEKRKKGEKYSVDDFVTDTVQFTKNERSRLIGLLEEEKL